jgi:hypothetical protein
MSKPSSVSQEARPASNQLSTPSQIEHFVCALAGLGSVAVLILIFTPLLFRTVEPFGVLSTTVLVVGLTALWMFVWISVESLWEWRAGRLFR